MPKPKTSPPRFDADCHVDQIYVLRRQQNTDRDQRYDDDEKNPIDAGVVWHLYETVRDHLSAVVRRGEGGRWRADG